MEPEITFIFIFIVTILSLKFFKKRILLKLPGLISMSALSGATSIEPVISQSNRGNQVDIVTNFSQGLDQLSNRFGVEATLDTYGTLP